MSQPYPLTFEPILMEKVWGGRRLELYGKALRPRAKYGESWEIADLDETSAGGGGGDAAYSVIDSGAMAGKTIRDAIKRWGGELLGARGLVAARSFGFRGDPTFPLLIKYLDAQEHLSVQTHPSRAYAAANPGAKLKTESWVVLDAQPTVRPDGVPTTPSLFIGTRPGVTPDRFRERLAAGAVVDELDVVPAVPGACWTLPSGTLHALGAGVLVAEVQTPSDTTFRVYDWQKEYGRPERAMHIDAALQCIDFTAGASSAPHARGAGMLASTPFYTIERIEPGADGSGCAELGSGACTVVMAIGGEGEIVCRQDGFAAVPLSKGRTALVPAVCAASAVIRGGAGFAALLVRIGAG